MMDNRLNLQTELEAILGSDKVYYQPPESIKINYPAIIYSRANIDNNFANNGVYGQRHVYDVIVIDADPDSLIVDSVSKIKSSRFKRHYTVNNLNHDVFSITR